MTLDEFLKEADADERTRVADAAGTSVAYLYQIAGGHRRPSTDLAKKISAATRSPHKVSKAELLPDVWGRSEARA